MVMLTSKICFWGRGELHKLHQESDSSDANWASRFSKLGGKQCITFLESIASSRRLDSMNDEADWVVIVTIGQWLTGHRERERELER